MELICTRSEVSCTGGASCQFAKIKQMVSLLNPTLLWRVHLMHEGTFKVIRCGCCSEDHLTRVRVLLTRTTNEVQGDQGLTAFGRKTTCCGR